MMYKLDQDLKTNETQYYFSFLTDRFIPTTDKWTRALSKKFGKVFKPIYLLPFKHNQLHEENNFIVINERLIKWQTELKRDDIFELIYPEDMNKQFSKSEFIHGLMNDLLKKQDKVYILPFSSVWLELTDPRVVILGPKPDVATIFDDKVEHIRVFKRLGIETNTTDVFASIDELKMKWKLYPFFFSAAFSSGGFESKVIETEADLIGFYNSLRPVNQNGPFIAAKLLSEIILAPNVSAMVTGLNETSLVCISDQLLRENNYMGNIYPSQATPIQKRIMQEVTKKIGNYMSTFGFRGMFGVDFLVSKDGSCYPTDINPRRQGGYFCNVMMSKKKDIVDMELSLALGETIQGFSLQDMDATYAWAHHKLVPYYHNVKILEELNYGTPEGPYEQIGSVYNTIYYPKDYILLTGNPGFYTASGYSYEALLKLVINETDKLISLLYSRVLDIEDVHAVEIHNDLVKNIFIESFHEGDLDAIDKILREFVKDPNGVREDEIQEIKQCMKGESNSQGMKHHYFIAHDSSGKVLGCAGFSLQVGDDLRTALRIQDVSLVGDLRNMFVSRLFYKGGGVGRALFNHICEALRKEGKREMVMDSGIRYKDNWGFFEKICQSPGVIIPNKYGPGWHTKAWKIFL